MIPKSLKIQNFLSHDTSEIDFDKFQAALILGSYDDEVDQSNGAGKSAIFEAIAWALFGKSRHKKVDGVVKWDKRACRVEFSFEVDGTLYRVTRTRDKVIRDADVTLEQWSGSEWDNVDCDTNSATDKKIVHIINFNYEVFVNSVYFKQDDISMFATATPSRRKDILKSLLKMDKWDEYQKKAKEHAKTLSVKIDEKEQQLMSMDNLEKGKTECEKIMAQIKKQIRASNQEYSKMYSDIITKKSQFQALYNGNEDIYGTLKKLQRDLLSAKKRREEIDNVILDNEKMIKDNTGKIAEQQQRLNLLKDKIKAKKEVNIEELRSKILVGQTKEQVLATQISDLKGDIKLDNDKCDVCEKPLTKKEIDEIRERRREQLRVAQEKYSETRKKLERAERTLKQKEKIVDDGNKAELDKTKTEIKISNWQDEINDCIEDNKRLAKEKTAINLSTFEKQISDLKIRSNKDMKEQLEKDIEALDKEVSNLKRQIDRLNVDYGSKRRRYNEIINLQKNQEILKTEVDKLKSSHSIYVKLRGYFGKEGIQSVIIENVIEELENYSNETLAKICNEPTSISIQTQKQTDSGSWTETFDIIVKAGARTDDFDTFSGGEKFRISLALRLALSNILSNRMGGVIKFLLLDEVSSNLDNKGLEMFINIVKQLSSEMKILVITHSERLKERFEDIIVVNKTQNGSQVCFQ